MNCLRLFVATMAMVGMTTAAMAANPSGTWTSTIALSGQSFDSTLRLKLDSEGNRLSGFETGGAQQRQLPISDASYGGGKVSFAVNHNFAGQPATIHYSGRLEGDTISGQAQIDHGDRKETAAWSAKRQR